MKGLNNVMLIGNVGADLVLKTLEGDIKVVYFSIATSAFSYKFSFCSGRTVGQFHICTELRTLVATQTDPF